MVRHFSLAVIVVAALCSCSRSPAEDFDAAVRALRYRPVEARLSSLPYAPWLRDRRGNPEALISEATVRKAARGARASPLVPLFLGDVGSATREFEKITATGNATAAQWSDYAALLHASAGPDDALQLATALAATEHALDLDPTFPAALFNRALILDALSLRGAAVAAYDTYLRVDQASPWAEETRSRRGRIDELHARASLWQERLPALQRAATAGDTLFVNDIVLTFPEESRRWGETIFLGEWADAVVSNNAASAQNRLSLCRLIGQSLEKQRGESLLADTVRGIDAMSDAHAIAEAVVAYRDGRLSYSRGDARGALRAFKSATQTFQTRLQPMELVARYYTASACLDIGLTVDALTQADHVERRAPSRYRALRAQLAWLYATHFERGGEHKYAAKSLRQVVDTFTALGEEQNAANTRNATADALRNAGAISEAWRLRHASLVSASARAQETQIARTVYSMAIDAIADGRWDVGYALLNVVSTMSEAPRDAIAWRIAAAKRSGLHRTAAVHLVQAQATRDFDPRVVDALIADDQSDAIRLLTASLKIAELTGTMSAREELLLERSQLLRATGQRALAERDADEAVALMNKRVYVMPIAALPELSAEANAQLAEPYGLRGDALRAIQASERMLLQRAAVPFAVPAQTTIITFGIFEDRTVVYALDAHRLRSAEVDVAAAQIREWITGLNRDSLEKNLGALSRALLHPISGALHRGNRIVFVVDPDLRQLPFAALQKPNGRHVIEDHPVVATTSIRAFLMAQLRKTTPSHGLLSVGNPTCDGCDESLPPLIGAEAEAREVAGMYEPRVMLVRGDATKERVIGALAYCDIAHFAVHANEGLADTVPPHLLLAPSRGDDRRLTTAEIAKLQLGGVRIVVLAGCRTAASSARKVGTQSLVDAFLAAGAGSVVGTLWEVEDAGTREMSILLHRALRNGATPADALRAAQIEMIRRKASPRVWAALQLFGSGS